MRTIQRAFFGVFVLFFGGVILVNAARAFEKKPPPARSETITNIVDVKILVQESEPPNLVVTVVGQVPTAGWKNAKLVRATYKKPPKDGIQDYTFSADRPKGPAATVVSRVVAENTWRRYTQAAPWLKGIRIRGVGDGVVVKMLR